MVSLYTTCTITIILVDDGIDKAFVLNLVFFHSYFTIVVVLVTEPIIRHISVLVCYG
jgi:hypothetical protein